MNLEIYGLLFMTAVAIWFETRRYNVVKALEAEKKRSSYLEFENKAERALIADQYEVLARREETIAVLTADRDKWQLEAAKRAAVIERQSGDVVRLEMSLKTAQRSNGVRQSNR